MILKHRKWLTWRHPPVGGDGRDGECSYWGHRHRHQDNKPGQHWGEKIKVVTRTMIPIVTSLFFVPWNGTSLGYIQFMSLWMSSSNKWKNVLHLTPPGFFFFFFQWTPKCLFYVLVLMLSVNCCMKYPTEKFIKYISGQSWSQTLAKRFKY